MRAHERVIWSHIEFTAVSWGDDHWGHILTASKVYEDLLPKNAADKLDGENEKQEHIGLLDEHQTKRELIAHIITRKWLYLDIGGGGGYA